MALFSESKAVKEPVRPKPSTVLFNRYTELIEVKMRNIAHLPRLFRMNLAGHLQYIWPYALPKVLSFKIQENDQFVDVAIVVGEKTIWTRWSPVSPKIQVHYGGEAQSVSNGDFRKHMARILEGESK